MGRHSSFKLDEDAVTSLEAFRAWAKTEQDVEADRRALAILMVGQHGYTREAAAQLCDASIRSVFGWQSSYIERGLEGLKERPIPGRPQRLTAEQLGRLKELIVAGPEASGLDTGVWTSPMLVGVVKREFDVEYSASQVRRILHKLGFSVQYPKKNSPRRTSRHSKSG